MSAIGDILRPILSQMSSGMGSIFGLSLTDVLKAPSEQSIATSNLMGTISETTVKPLAAIVLTVLFMIELNRILLITDGDGDTRFQTVFFSFVKFGVIYVVFDKTPLVLNTVYNVCADMAIGAHNVLTSPGGDPYDTESFVEAAEKLDWLGQTILLVFMLFALLVYKGAVLIGLGLVILRFVKLYIYGAFFTVPMALLATQETRPWGVGFLKNYAATVLQAFVMVIAFAVFQTLTSEYAEKALSSLPGGSMEAALQIGSYYMFMGVALGLVVASSGKVANELLGG